METICSTCINSQPYINKGKKYCYCFAKDIELTKTTVLSCNNYKIDTMCKHNTGIKIISSRIIFLNKEKLNYDLNLDFGL